MAKVRWKVASRARRKRLIKTAKGNWGARKNLIRRVKETMMRAKAYATRDRKNKKRSFRNLWVIRLNAAASERGLTYSRMIAALKQAKIGLNRQQLAELAVNDPSALDQLLTTAGVSAAPASAAKA